MEWLVSAGDWVEEGQPLAEVHTILTMQEVFSPFTGRLLTIEASAGATVAPGDSLAVVDTTAPSSPAESTPRVLASVEDIARFMHEQYQVFNLLGIQASPFEPVVVEEFREFLAWLTQRAISPEESDAMERRLRGAWDTGNEGQATGEADEWASTRERLRRAWATSSPVSVQDIVATVGFWHILSGLSEPDQRTVHDLLSAEILTAQTPEGSGATQLHIDEAAPVGQTLPLQDRAGSLDHQSQARQDPSRARAEARGPCEQCEHVRYGASIARPAFNEVLDAVKSGVRRTQTFKMQEESQTSGQFFSDLETNRQFNIDRWTRRPTVPSIKYCGVAEFDGTYHVCEVKNKDLACSQFTPRSSDPIPHACGSCMHNRRPSDQVFQVLEQTMGRRPKGQQLRDQTRQSLDYQAESEYQDCIDGVGVLRARPGMLPVCEARSSAGDESGQSRYVVGPVVNGAERCDKWSAGANQVDNQVAATLALLVSRAQQATSQYVDSYEKDSPGPFIDHGGGRWVDGDVALQQSNQMQSLAGNAEADLIVYCLLALGADPGFAASIGTRYTADVYFAQRQAGSYAGGAMSGTSASEGTASAASAGDATISPALATEASAPFLMQPDTVYSHPRSANLHLVMNPYPPREAAFVQTPDGVMHKFGFSTFQPGVWTQLRSDLGPLPITLNVQLPRAVYAAWY